MPVYSPVSTSLIPRIIFLVYFLDHVKQTTCRTSNTGREYVGILSVTMSGKDCQRWDSVTPHDHSYTAKSDLPDRDTAHNYCRNPNRSEYGPWCFTTDPEVRWEACDIPLCGKPFSRK